MATISEIFKPLNPSNEPSSLNVDQTSKPESGLTGNKKCGENETVELYNNLTNQINDMYSVELLYWRYHYDKDSDHPIFKEDTDAEYKGPYSLKGYFNINSDLSVLASFGIDTSNDIDLFIPFDEWNKLFAKDVSPIAKDVFTPRYLFCPDQSPSGFTKIYFEVTSQGDGDLQQIFQQQKYFWNIKGARFDFSWQPNAPREDNGNNVFLGDHQGTVEGSGDDPTTDKGEDNTDPTDLDDLSKNNLDTKNKSSIYGRYTN